MHKNEHGFIFGFGIGVAYMKLAYPWCVGIAIVIAYKQKHHISDINTTPAITGRFWADNHQIFGQKSPIFKKYRHIILNFNQQWVIGDTSDMNMVTMIWHKNPKVNRSVSERCFYKLN